jgi:tetratricopeptide (TPR) repeat protein
MWGRNWKNSRVATAYTTKAQQALALCERGQWPEALAFAQRWHVEAPTEAKALFYEGVALTGLGRFVAAETAYYRALALDAQDFPTWTNLAALLFEALNQPAEAAKCLAQAMLIDPGNELGWTKLAGMYRHLGRHAQALGCAERALALDPELAEAHLQRGRAAQTLQRPEVVRAACEALSRLPPEKFQRAT